MTLGDLYGWLGYGFWGLLVSVIGSCLSVYYAHSANSNAIKAASAAESAKKTISAVDGISEFSRVLRLLKEIRLRAERSEWDRVSEITEDVRVIIAAITTNSFFRLSDSSDQIVTGILTQMATMARTADRAHHKNTPVDSVQLKTVLARLSEDVSKVLSEMKERVET